MVTSGSKLRWSRVQTMVRVVSCALLAVGIVTSVALIGLPASAQGANRNIFYFRAVYAAYELGYGDGYSVDVGGRYDMLTGVTTVQARGRLYGTDNLYYFAFDHGEGNRLSVDHALDRAVLDGIPVIQYCFDGNGDEVVDPRCPIGEVVQVHATFTSQHPMEFFEDHHEGGSNLVRGRQAEASATHDGHGLGSSIYGEIVENFTTTRTG